MLQRLNLIKSLVNLTGNEEWVTEWSDLERRIDALRIRRNDAIHSIWEFAGNEHVGTRIKSKGRVNLSVTPTHTNELWELASRLMDITKPILDFGDKLLAGGAPKLLRLKRPPGPLPTPHQVQQARSRTQARARKRPPPKKPDH